jgi:TolB-like protein/class 3 adenylate cyclase
VAEVRVERRLAAILAADVAGYSRLMGADEVGTLTALKALRREIFDPAIAEHRGRIVKTTGDGMLVEFASAVDAVTCAMTVQGMMGERRAASEHKISFRIGINIGDIIIDGDDIFGDGVNVASRVENECVPGGVYLSGGAFEQVRGKTGFAFDDLGEKNLKNIDRPVRLFSARAASPEAAAANLSVESAKPLPLPDKPSIAVLPFQNMSGDAEQEYFADGMVEDIITALSRFKSLFVIARNSSFTYKGKAVDIKQIGRELGVRYVLEGSVRRAGNRLRITAQLIDARSGDHVWADRFEGSPQDVFALQDEVTEKVVVAIAPRVERAEISRALRRSSDNTDAYDCYLRGLSCVAFDTNQALGLFSRASALDPDFASAHGMAMFCHANRIGFGLTEDFARERDEVSRLWRIVARIGNDDGVALAQAGWAVAYVLRDLPSGKRLLDRAVELNPNLANGWNGLGWVNVWLGNPAAAIEQFSRSHRLDPNPSFNTTITGLAHACFFLDRFEEAFDHAEQVLRRNPNAHPGLRIAAASAAFAGRIDVAHRLAAHLLKVDPAFCNSRLKEYLGPYQRAEFLEKYAEGLRRAGLPEVPTATNSRSA